jgi:hypothetical protein
MNVTILNLDTAIAEEVMSVVIVMSGHSIDNVKFSHSPNHGQYGLLYTDLLFDFWRDNSTWYAPFR